MNASAPSPTNTRDGFTTQFGVLAATLGSAVGLGNIWKFPYLTGANGGASFLLVYLLATLLIGLPLMIGEITLGRTARTDCIGTLKKLAPGTFWWVIGLMGIVAAYLILSFYTEVAAWVLAYIFKAIKGDILSSDPATTLGAFQSLTADPWQSLLWQWAILLLIGGVLVGGVAKGIEAVSKKLMPLLFILLLIICVRSLMLPGASTGLHFLFAPDFSQLTGQVILTAMGLAFFKLSVGMGTMMTYGSYFRPDQNIPRTALNVMLADLFVSLLAGIAIFPAVFAFGFKPEAGPALLFSIIPAVFSHIPFGQFFMVLFFLLSTIAAIGAMLSLLEVPVSILCERFSMTRHNATLISLVLLIFTGALCALSNGTLANVKLFGMNFFDLCDYLSSNIFLPLGGILICLFISWVWGPKRYLAAISNQGSLTDYQVIFKLLFFITRWVSPILILLIMLKGLGVSL